MSYRTKAVIPYTETETEYQLRIQKEFKLLKLKKRFNILLIRFTVPMIAPIIIGLLWTMISSPIRFGIVISAMAAAWALDGLAHDLSRDD